ncbi:LptF/LptG family permease [Pontiellaceae bacterium B1224]|nr:LptF/LptG family permease [Pontiellaceae bacterium B1224]
MRKLTKYLLFDFMGVFGVAIFLITFSFSIGAIYKAIDVMAKGIPVGIIGKFLVYNLPYSLAYTIPISCLFSALLLFGRLSSDSEISAMRSGGLSLWQIASPVLLVSVVLSGVCLYNNCVLYPETTYANRKLLQNLGVEDPIKLLEEGRFIREFPGYMIYVGKKNRNKVKDLIVYEVDKTSGKITSTVRAESGMMSVDKEDGVLKIDLYDVRIEVADSADSDDESKTTYVNARKYPIRLDIDAMMRKGTLDKKPKNMTLSEVIGVTRKLKTDPGMLQPRDAANLRCKYLIEIHQRICLSLSPFMFTIIAIPLGIRSHRKESSIGMLMSLAIMFLYYLFIIASDTFDKNPEFYPWLLPWVPIILGQIGGVIMIRRAN